MVNTNKYIVSIANRADSLYEINNVGAKREQFFLENNLDSIIKIINNRYQTKEDKIIAIKIIKIDGGEQLTMEFIFNSTNRGFFVRKSNPNKKSIYNSTSTNSYSTSIIDNLFPLDKEKILSIDVVKSFFMSPNTSNLYNC